MENIWAFQVIGLQYLSIYKNKVRPLFLKMSKIYTYLVEMSESEKLKNSIRIKSLLLLLLANNEFTI